MNKKSYLISSIFVTSTLLYASNQITLQSYESKADEYAHKTQKQVVTTHEWLDRTLQYIKIEDRILELGSGFGRDAQYVESLGYKVQRTDAAQSFIHALQKQGYDTLYLNILTDELPQDYPLIFANRVLLHFTPEEVNVIVGKIFNSLPSNGIFAFSIKHGVGTEWTEEKIGAPRFYCYWMPTDIEKLVTTTGFELLDLTVTEDNGYKCIYIIARKPQLPPKAAVL